MQSTWRVIRQALVEIIESKTATQGELLKACRLLSKITLAPKGKPRGRPFTKKVGTGAEKSKNNISSILERIYSEGQASQ